MRFFPKSESWKRTNDSQEGDSGEQSTPGDCPQDILDIIHRPRGAAEDDQLDIVDDQPHNLQKATSGTG